MPTVEETYGQIAKWIGGTFKQNRTFDNTENKKYINSKIPMVDRIQEDGLPEESPGLTMA